jgi:putative transposase
MERRVYDSEGHAHFVTFSCYKRRRLLDDDRAKGTVIHFLAEELRKKDGSCVGFVIMPNHVHALLHFKKPGMLSGFIQQWKRKSSNRLKNFFDEHFPAYAAEVGLREPIWQAGFHDFNVFGIDKVTEKLEYMHNNPARMGLVANARQWRYSSARWYLMRAQSARGRISKLPK